MKTKHTPGPWEQVPNDKSIVAVNIQPHPDGGYTWDTIVECSEADAAHIVRCVNSHDELVVTAKNALVLLKQLQDLSSRDIGVVVQIEESLQYVLAKATGGAE